MYIELVYAYSVPIYAYILCALQRSVAGEEAIIYQQHLSKLDTTYTQLVVRRSRPHAVVMAMSNGLPGSHSISCYVITHNEKFSFFHSMKLLC